MALDDLRKRLPRGYRDLGKVMVLYWAESAVIGFFNICKIIVIGRWFALLAAPFFAGHFGGFMVIHFLFIFFFIAGGVLICPIWERTSCSRKLMFLF